MKRGDMLRQIAFGSGFKCNSADLECLQDGLSSTKIIDKDISLTLTIYRRHRSGSPGISISIPSL